jgi:hypothetical protein
MAEPEAFSTDRYDNLSTTDISMLKSPFLLSAFLYRINEITKLDKVCYNDSLLVSFLPLWVPSVNPCPPKMTDPEACRFYGVGFVLMQIWDNKLYGTKSITFEHYYNEKARIAIWRVASSPVSHLFITNYGQPRAFPETNNSSLKREFRHQYCSLFASPVKWWLDRLSVDANIIVAGIFYLSRCKVEAILKQLKQGQRNILKIYLTNPLA